MSFWAKYKSQFDFRDRVIRMVVNGANAIIPFTIGDKKSTTESAHEEEEVALYALEDTVVQPGQGYMVAAKPARESEKSTRAWDTWALAPMADKEAEERMKRVQEEETWHMRINTRAREQAAERAADMRQQAERRQRWDDGVRRMETEMQEEEWDELGHRVTQWHLMEDMEEEEEEIRENAGQNKLQRSCE